MRAVTARVLDTMIRWLDGRHEARLERWALAGQEPCPSCVFIRNDAGNIVEVIDCRTLGHNNTQEE